PKCQNSFKSPSFLPLACSFPKETYPRWPPRPSISYFFFASMGRAKKHLISLYNSSTSSSLKKWLLKETNPISSYAFPISFTNFCFFFGSSYRKSAKFTLGILFITLDFIHTNISRLIEYYIQMKECKELGFYLHLNFKL